jgi:hypothetical protein
VAAEDDAGTSARRIAIRLDRSDDPIEGIVVGDGDEERSFLGWTGLLAALELAFRTHGR